jgi:threonine synthase
MSGWKWREFFPAVPEASRVTLGEGQTPLVRSRRLGPSVGLKNLYFKLEMVNPTGSYKDRFAAAAISDMIANRKRRCFATSSGNTGAALAAYCAAAGIVCEIAIVETAPAEKLQQMLAYGAKIYRVEGLGTSSEKTPRIFQKIQQLAAAPDASLQISAFVFSPAGMAGVKTISYELMEQTAGKLDHVFVPAGGGGLTLAAARGFAEWVDRGKNTRGPSVHCVQPVGNDTIASCLRNGAAHAKATTCTTQISGLQVASVLDGDQVVASCRASGGTGHLVDDEAVWNMQKRLAREEGIFCEPAGAVSVTAALAASASGEIPPNDVVCCLITGSGFKDAPSIARMVRDAECPMVGFEEFVSK